MVAPSRLSCLPLLSVFAMFACGQPQASADAEKIEEAITRLDDKLAALDDRLAQMDARTAALAEAKQAALVRDAKAAEVEARAEGLATAVELAAERASKPSARVEVLVDAHTLKVDDEAVTLEQLESHVREAVAGKDVTVEIQADADTDHARLIEVMDAVRNAGVERLAIAKRTDGVGLD